MLSLQLHLPLNSPLVGSELTKEPFRWDQRLFSLVLRLPGATRPDNEQLGSVPTDDSAITQMCEVTGGLAFSLFLNIQGQQQNHTAQTHIVAGAETMGNKE